MAQLSNTPQALTVIRFEQLRPAAITIELLKQDDTAVDLTGCTLRIVIANPPRKGGAVLLSQLATDVLLTSGLMRFDLQADDLDFAVGEYPFSMTLVTPEGYQSTIVRGVIDMQANPDPSVPVDYTAVAPPLGLTIALLDNNRITVKVNHHPDSVLMAFADAAENWAFEAELSAESATASAAAAAAAVALINPLLLSDDAAITWIINNLASNTRTTLDGIYADLASPALTGNPTAPTPATADDDTTIATTAFVHNVVDNEIATTVDTNIDNAISTAISTTIATNIDAAVDAAVDAVTATHAPWVSPVTYGAVGDGVTDDTAALNLALAAGNVQFHGRRYKVNGTLVFPADKSQLGMGSGSTVFVMGNAGKIRLGSLTDVPVPQEAGKTGGFSIEGNLTTPVGLHTACVGRGRVMEDIFVYNCVINVLVEGSQNMLWLGLDVAHGSYGVVLDKGAGGNHFIGLQTLDQTVYTLDIRNSGDPTFPPGTFYSSTLGCTDNHFTNCRFEIPAATALAAINVGAGFRNSFYNCLVSGQNLAAGMTAVRVSNIGGVGALYTLFQNCLIQGDGVVGAGITAINTGGYTIVKNCIISNVVKMFKADDLDLFWCDGVFAQNQDVATYFAAVAGATSTVLTVFRGPDPTPWVSFAVAEWSAGADDPAVRRCGPRIEYRGIAKAAAGGGIPAAIGTVPAPADARSAFFANRGPTGGESIQVAGTSMLTNMTVNNQELFLDGMFYDVDQ